MTQMGYDHGVGVLGVLWGLTTLALLVLIIVAIIWLIRHLVRTSGSSTRNDLAEEELRRRYAAGEIDQEEFRRRRNDLRER
jgi:putative membrane protein